MPNDRRRLIGRVVSNKMDKTVVVAIDRRKAHPVYQKVVGVRKKVMAHDETNQVQIGSLVRIVESRPLSKNKRWVVEAVIEDLTTDIGAKPTIQEEVIATLDEAGVTTEVTAEAPTEAQVEVTAEAPAEASETQDEQS